METQNYGKLKIGIDWEDKGWVSFGQETYNADNILGTKSRYFATALGTSVAGYATVKQSINPLGLYGLEELAIDFHEDTGFVSLGSINLTGMDKIPLEESHDYTFWYWLSSSNDYTNDGTHIFTVSIDEYDIGGVLTATNQVNVDLLGNGVVYSHYISFTSNVDTAYAHFEISKTDTDYSSLRIILHGIIAYDFVGIIAPAWGDGSASPEYTIIDNDITSYVMQAQGSIGKTAWETILFDEGQLTLTLNNEDRRFSPEYTSGAYYGSLKPYRRVWVAIEDSTGIYRLLWSGWTHQFQIQTGNKGTRQATITARQGKYNIEAQDADALVASEAKHSVELILDIFSGGYVIPSQLGDATTTRDAIIQEYDDDGVTVPIFGIEFVEKPEDKKYLTSLEHVAELNGNYMFLTRQGRIAFKTYQSVKDTIPEELPYSLTDACHYVYSPSDLYKQIVVDYSNYALAGTVEMQGQDVILSTPATDFPFSVYPRYNNMPLIGDVVLDVSSFLPTDYTAVPTTGSASSAFTAHVEGLYTWYSGLAQNSTDLDYRLSLVSRDSGDVWYAVDINQHYIVVGIADIALDTLTYSNPLITNETMAEDFANMQVNRRASIVAWFDQAKLSNKSANSVDWIVSHSVGDVIFVHEEQSGDIPKHLIIIGESFSYTPTYFQMTYDIAPTGAEVDVAAFTYTVNGAIVTFNDESATSLTPDYLWDFGD